MLVNAWYGIVSHLQKETAPQILGASLFLSPYWHMIVVIVTLKQLMHHIF